MRLQAADPPPALPTDGNTSAARSLALGESASLDELGPVVVTESGQLRYIDNWADMSEAEREATQRIIARRNAARRKTRHGTTRCGRFAKCPRCVAGPCHALLRLAAPPFALPCPHDAP